MLVRWPFAIAALFLLSCTTGFAQIQTTAAGQPPAVAEPGRNSATRSIRGKVLNRAGETIAGAVVLLKDTKTLQVRSFIAQQDGSYHFFGLSMDVNYELRAQASGMTSKTRTVSVFNSHQEVKLDLKLAKKLKS